MKIIGLIKILVFTTRGSMQTDRQTDREMASMGWTRKDGDIYNLE